MGDRLKGNPVSMIIKSKALVTSPGLEISAQKKKLIEVVQSFGECASLVDLSCEKDKYGRRGLVCDYYDIRTTTQVVATLNGSMIDNSIIIASYYLDIKSVENTMTSHYRSKSAHSLTVARPKINFPISKLQVQKFWKDPDSNLHFKSSLMDASSNSMEENLKHGSLDMYRKDVSKWEAANSNIVTKADLPKNNVVDLDRIARGLDTRTTLMLRNIPNKVDQQMLKEYIDVTNEKTYDFLCKWSMFDG